MSTDQANPDRSELQAQLQAWISSKHPERQGLEISDFTVPEAGASNETLLFDIRWQEDGQTQTQELVARLKPEGQGVFPEYDLDLQYRAMSRLQDSDVVVPVMAGMETDPSVLGRPFYLMERINGQYLADNPPYQMDGWLTQVTPEQRTGIWENAMRAIASVNRVDWQSRGFEDLWDKDKHATPLAQLLAYYEEFLVWAESLGRPFDVAHKVLAYLKANQPQDEVTALCWGDAKPPNLMISGTEIVGVLDWEMVHLGNPVHDLAWWFVLDDSLTDGLNFPKLEGIPPRQHLIDIWQTESQFSAEQFPYYEFLSTFQFAVIMHRVGTRLTAQGFFAKEDEFDLKNNCTPLLERQMAEFGL